MKKQDNANGVDVIFHYPFLLKWEAIAAQLAIKQVCKDNDKKTENNNIIIKQTPTSLMGYNLAHKLWQKEEGPMFSPLKVITKNLEMLFTIQTTCMIAIVIATKFTSMVVGEASIELTFTAIAQIL